MEAPSIRRKGYEETTYCSNVYGVSGGSGVRSVVSRRQGNRHQDGGQECHRQEGVHGQESGDGQEGRDRLHGQELVSSSKLQVRHFVWTRGVRAESKAGFRLHGRRPRAVFKSSQERRDFA